jgi:hypothetical protein
VGLDTGGKREGVNRLRPELAEGWSDEIRFDLGELLDEHGIFKSPKDVSPKTRRLLQRVKIKGTIVKEGGARMLIERYVDYKLPDRQKARIELGKRIGFYPAEKSEVTVNHNVPKLTPEQYALAQKLLDEWLERKREAKRALKSGGTTS